MFGQFTNFSRPLCALGNLYLIILIARAILSWFPLSNGSPLLPVVRFLHAVTEPVLRPMRRVIPPAGMLDLSFLVTFLLFQFLILPVLCAIRI
jgi:YggT family protein